MSAPPSFEDPRIAAGMKQLLARRRELLAAGTRPLGWKIAFSAPAAMERLGTPSPLAGFLSADAVIRSGDPVSLSGWTKPIAEPEIAVRLGCDLPAHSSAESVSASIAGLEPAFELVDVAYAPTAENLKQVIAANIFQRHVVLGADPKGNQKTDFGGLAGRVRKNGVEIASTADPQSATGNLVEVLRRTADLLGVFGERFRAGDLIITGSIVPPIPVQAGDELTFHLDPIGAISVRFAKHS